MLLDSLRVIHWSKRLGAVPTLFSEQTFSHRAFGVETCQRLIWVGTVHSLPANAETAEVFRGAQAYAFLLRVATGLESEIRGETDVFGQLKFAWATWLENDGADAAELQPWVQRIFEDTKEIRSRFLHHTGGDSYGSLVRKLIRQNSFDSSEPILLVGAGHLARSVAPWLSEHEIWVWNRSQASARTLVEELKAKEPTARVRIIEGKLDERNAWREACHAVICIPASDKEDPARAKLWIEGSKLAPSAQRSIVHLGGLVADCERIWGEIPNFSTLDDVFALQKRQNQAREEQFARAWKACEEKARLRSLAGTLGGSLTLPHGWEDLAVFV